MRLRRRIARIMKERQMGMVGYRLPDGGVKYIRGKNQFDAFIEACEGLDTPGARLMLQATQCVTPGGGLLHELAQSIAGDGPAVEHRKETGRIQ